MNHCSNWNPCFGTKHRSTGLRTLFVSLCVHACLPEMDWCPFQDVSHLTRSVPRMDSVSTIILTRIKRVMKVPECKWDVETTSPKHKWSSQRMKQCPYRWARRASIIIYIYFFFLVITYRCSLFIFASGLRRDSTDNNRREYYFIDAFYRLTDDHFHCFKSPY